MDLEKLPCQILICQMDQLREFRMVIDHLSTDSEIGAATRTKNPDHTLRRSERLLQNLFGRNVVIRDRRSVYGSE
jgi:hypothetical protein